MGTGLVNIYYEMQDSLLFLLFKLFAFRVKNMI